MRIVLLVAMRNLVQARRRTALLGSAIALVTAALVLLLSMAGGIRDNLVTAATTMASGHVTVAGFYKPRPNTAAALVDELSRVRAIVEQNTPGLDDVVDRGRGWGKLVSATASQQAALTGVVAADEERFFSRLRLAKESEYAEGGRDEVIGDPRRLSEPNTIVIFATQARRLDAVVGDMLTIQTEIPGGRTNTADVTVVAVAKDMGLLSDFSVYVPKDLTIELYQFDRDTTGALWVYLDDIDQSDETMRHLRDVFEREGFQLLEHQNVPFYFKFETVAGEDWVGQKIDVTTWEDEVSFLTWVVTAFETVTSFLVGILVVIIAVGITNTMWNAVRERTREIGTMRAIGMQRRTVLALFVAESLLLGLFATSFGALLGAGVALGLDRAGIDVPNDAMAAILLMDTFHFAVQPMQLAVAVVVLTVFTVLAALWPAIRAARLPPISALGHTE